jgi:hypothetical protein
MARPRIGIERRRQLLEACDRVLSSKRPGGFINLSFRGIRPRAGGRYLFWGDSGPQGTVVGNCPGGVVVRFSASAIRDAVLSAEIVGGEA